MSSTELIERLRDACTDWDGSQEVEGAELVKPITCGEARAIIAALAALPAPDVAELVERLNGEASAFARGEDETDAGTASLLREAAAALRTLSTGEREGWTEAARDVLAERRRQVEVKGWTPEHDDTHAHGEMAGAAACYALYRSHVPAEELMGAGILEMSWPWAGEWWKPTDRRRDLVKAAALILAEIERLDRLPASPSKGGV